MQRTMHRIKTMPKIDDTETTSIVTLATAQFRSALIKGDRERKREAANHGMMDGTYYRQWLFDGGAIAQMVQEGRAPTSINIVKKPINDMVGSILAEKYEGHFDGEEGEDPRPAKAIQGLYDKDSEIYDWHSQIGLIIRDGFIYRGWGELSVDRSKTSFGRVKLRHMQPDRIICDPDWTTPETKDNKFIYTFSYKSAQEIKNMILNRKNEFGIGLPKAKLMDHLNELIKRDEWGSPTGAGLLVLPYDYNPDMRDDADGTYLVFNKYELDRRVEDRIWDADKNQFLDLIPPEDREKFVKMAKKVGRHVSMVESEIYYEKVVTCCPALTTEGPLDGGDSELQTGSYNLISFSCDHLFGHPNTPVDILTDPQRTINQREQWITKILGTSASNAKFAENDVSVDTKGRRHIEKNINTPGFFSWVKPGSKGRVWSLGADQAPNNFMQANNQILKIAENNMIPSTPATQGLTDSGDSGILFQAKVAQALVGNAVSKIFIGKFFHALHEEWFNGALDTYTYPMKLNTKSEVLWLNIEGGIIIPSISRVKISVVESPQSQTRKSQNIQTYVAVAQYIPGAATKQKLAKSVIENIEGIPDKELAAILSTADLESQNADLDLQIQILTKQSQLKQLQGGPQAPTPPPEKVSFSVALKGEDLKDPVIAGFATANGIHAGAPAGVPVPGSTPLAPPGKSLSLASG